MAEKANKITVVRVKVSGMSPLLMNHMDEATIDGLIDPAKRKPVQKDRPFEEVAGGKIYREGDAKDGAIGIPVENLLACLVEAGRSVKNGKAKISTATGTQLYAMMAIREAFLKFTNLNGNGKGWVVDKRRGVLKQPAGKSVAVGILRPKFPEWQFEFTVEIDDTEANEALIRQLVETAGKKVGLGDFRPTCRGPFGRFQVVGWEKVDAAA